MTDKTTDRPADRTTDKPATILFTKESIVEMIKGVDKQYVDIIVKKLKIEFIAAVNEINKETLINNRPIVPPHDLIFNAFRLTPLDKLKVVIIGQDPYPNDQAMGLSFSASRAPVPASLKNIYECLVHNGLVSKKPTHGDLSSWAAQGVLLLNAALTCEAGRSNAHAGIWEHYTNKLLEELSYIKPLIFILFGKFAHAKESYLAKQSTVLKWGHPSPLNIYNKSDNPAHFKYCTVFRQCNEALKTSAINWNSVNPAAAPIYFMVPVSELAVTDLPITEPPPKLTLADIVGAEFIAPEYSTADTATVLSPSLHHFINKTYVFTDGGSKANGKINCTASWAFIILTPDKIYESYGAVPKKELGQKYSASNNRGELMGIYHGLYTAAALNLQNICVVSDSKYSINCISVWIKSWIKNNDIDGDKYKNLDLIVPAHKIYSKLAATMKHVNSHLSEPASGTETWFYWYFNDRVDKLTQKV